MNNKLAAVGLAAVAAVTTLSPPASAASAGSTASTAGVRTAAVAKAAPVVSRCDWIEGFLCITVNGNRGKWVIAGVTYKKEKGPRRAASLCWKVPRAKWKCSGGYVLNKGKSYSKPFSTKVRAGCYKGAIYTNGRRYETACLNK
ncbi:hypothetical protein SMC26_15875 [Actinomadura fulvescens]|uniref:Uncharacterized protein n=1 Tax=Actinomadura fulvescens TaxID=46160 RepID=A0ABN3QW25_9ACTN